MIPKLHGLMLVTAWIYACQGRHVGSLECPEQFHACLCENWTNDEANAVKRFRCSEQSGISCFLDKNCNTSSKLCLNCHTKGSTLCKECCCKRSIRSSSSTHAINKRQAGDQTLCSKPVDPENGRAIYEADVFDVGEAVKYRCIEGFTMIGSGTRHCDRNGKWAGELPTCEKLCSFPPIDSQGSLSYVENPGRTESLRDTRGNVVLSEIAFKCDLGFSLIGPGRIRCLTGGRWDRDPPKCRKSGQTQCPNPGVLEHGEHESTQSSTHSFGKVVTFKCNHGFQLLGSSVAVCTDSGTWSSPLPRCMPSEKPPATTSPSTIRDGGAVHCQKPSEPKHGTMSIKLQGGSDRFSNLLDVGTSVEYLCNHPYKLDGQPQQFCLATGQWSGRTPRCSPACGKGVEPKSPQVVNGNVAKENAYPWQVVLTTHKSRAEIRFIHCGGVVLSNKWVLTAAHCITKESSRDLINADSLRLFFGKHYADRNLDSNNVISRKVIQLVMHPDYDPWTLDSDLGLMLLDRDLDFNDVIVPLCLPTANSKLTFQEGLKGVVTGWGNIDKEGTAAPVLMMLELPIVNSKKCEDSYRSHNLKTTVTENMFCAGEDEGGRNTCRGDSGGAMAFYQDDHYVLEGIISWGKPDDCAVAGLYGGFVRVRNFISWILFYI